MADEAAVIDAPAEETPAIDGGASTEVDSSSTQVEDGGAEPQLVDGSESLKGSALWREVKTLTAEGKPLTPKQLSALNKVIHRADAVDQKYPDGLSRVEKTMEAIRQLAPDQNVPIEEVIDGTVKELNFFHELDQLFSTGKSEFVDKLNETAPEAFQNIAPAVFRKYAEVNPEAYSAYVAQAVMGHMNAAEVPLQFRILASFLPQIPDGPAKDQVLSAVNAIYAWSETLKGLASTKVQPKAIPGAETRANGDDLATQNENLKLENSRIQWNASIRDEGINFVFSEAQKAAGKVQLSDQDKKTVLAKVAEEMEARLTVDKQYGQAMQQYLKTGNRSAYLQRIQSERKKIIPGAVRRAVADVIESRPTNAPKAAVNGNGIVKKPAAPQLNGAPQFRRIAGHPKTLGMVVDLGPGKTTHSMLLKQQAYVKGQKEPVTWAK
jgi:hypothetical protein